LELFTLKPRTGPTVIVALPGLLICATVYNEVVFRVHIPKYTPPNLYIKLNLKKNLKQNLNCFKNHTKFFAVNLCKNFSFLIAILALKKESTQNKINKYDQKIEFPLSFFKNSLVYKNNKVKLQN